MAKEKLSWRSKACAHAANYGVFCIVVMDSDTSIWETHLEILWILSADLGLASRRDSVNAMGAARRRFAFFVSPGSSSIYDTLARSVPCPRSLVRSIIINRALSMSALDFQIAGETLFRRSRPCTRGG